MFKTQKMTYWEAPIFAYSNMNKAHSIIRIVSEQTGVTVDQMKSKRKPRKITEARHLSFLFLRKYTTLTLEQVAATLNLTNHSTVIHGIEHIGELIDTETPMKLMAYNIDALCENMEYTFEEPTHNNG